MITFQPLKDWLMLELIKPTLSGIIIPEDMQDLTKSGGLNSFKVIAKGPLVKEIEIGDTIVPYYNPVLIHSHEGQTIYLFKEEFVAATGR